MASSTRSPASRATSRTPGTGSAAPPVPAEHLHPLGGLARRLRRRGTLSVYGLLGAADRQDAVQYTFERVEDLDTIGLATDPTEVTVGVADLDSDGYEDLALGFGDYAGGYGVMVGYDLTSGRERRTPHRVRLIPQRLAQHRRHRPARLRVRPAFVDVGYADTTAPMAGSRRSTSSAPAPPAAASGPSSTRRATVPLSHRRTAAVGRVSGRRPRGFSRGAVPGWPGNEVVAGAAHPDGRPDLVSRSEHEHRAHGCLDRVTGGAAAGHAVDRPSGLAAAGGQCQTPLRRISTRPPPSARKPWLRPPSNTGVSMYRTAASLRGAGLQRPMPMPGPRKITRPSSGPPTARRPGRRMSPAGWTEQGRFLGPRHEQGE